MLRKFTHSRTVWLGVGLIAGLIVGGLWPDTPLHAVSNDRSTSFAIATGPLDEDVEALYFLDFLTGDLRAVVLSKLGGFNAFYQYNVLADLGIDPSKNPKYMMVTGVANMQRGGARMQPGRSIVYVAEITTGKVAAYSIPWNSALRNANVPFQGQLVPLDVTRFRAAAGGGAGVGPGTAVPSR